MTNWKRIISLLLAAVLLVNASASALADTPHVMTQTELEAAWALTGLDENAAQYREGMAFSEHMNAQQLKCWLDELLDEEVAGIKHLYSELETTLYEIEQGFYDPLFGSVELPRPEGEPDALVLSACRQGVIFLAVILIASRRMGYTGVILAQAISDALTAALAVLLMRRYKP